MQQAAIDVEKWFRQYGPMVLRRCRQLLGDAIEAEDVAQDVFVKVMQGGDSISGEYPSSFLWRIATNLCLNKIRDSKRHAENTEPTLLDRIAVAEDFERQFGARQLLGRLFDKHPESSRTIAVLHLHDGMSLEEVAAEVGMSVSGVRKRLRTLRASLVELEEV